MSQEAVQQAEVNPANPEDRDPIMTIELVPVPETQFLDAHQAYRAGLHQGTALGLRQALEVTEAEKKLRRPPRRSTWGMAGALTATTAFLAYGHRAQIEAAITGNPPSPSNEDAAFKPQNPVFSSAKEAKIGFNPHHSPNDADFCSTVGDELATFAKSTEADSKNGPVCLDLTSTMKEITATCADAPEFPGIQNTLQDLADGYTFCAPTPTPVCTKTDNVRSAALTARVEFHPTTSTKDPDFCSTVLRDLTHSSQSLKGMAENGAVCIDFSSRKDIEDTCKSTSSSTGITATFDQLKREYQTCTSPDTTK